MADAAPEFGQRVDLAGLLDQARDPDALVAWRSDFGSGPRPATWGGLRAAVARLRNEIVELPPGPVALATQDAYAFGVGLFALWHAERVAVCPPNTQAGALAALEDLVIATVSDVGVSVPGRPALSTETDDPAGADTSTVFGTLSTDAPAIELFTSGTTGRGKAIPKQLFHLENEVRLLDAELGPEVGDAPILGSASHQHLYGMLFRLLWPLAVGRVFDAQVLLHAEEINARMDQYGSCAFASVPAHLKRLAERDGLERIAGRCQIVFSSGGPLDLETAIRWESAGGRAPLELFGSTETGGVAWRRQGSAPTSSPLWTPLRGVEVKRDEPDGRLRVLSSFVSQGEAGEGFAMGDRIEFEADGRFRTLGRVDRVLKIGEKRLSLPEMEERLLEHGFVAAAALLPLDQGGERRVAAVVVLSGEGERALAREGRREVGVALSNALASEWERTLLPRAWRFVAALPEDAQGKVTVPQLKSLFDEPVAGGVSA
jgi:acyl-coenzyme A synthetase/AMP-(fatty) acid ligase